MKKILSILLTYLITLCLKRKSIIIQKILKINIALLKKLLS